MTAHIDTHLHIHDDVGGISADVSASTGFAVVRLADDVKISFYVDAQVVSRLLRKLADDLDGQAALLRGNAKAATTAAVSP